MIKTPKIGHSYSSSVNADRAITPPREKPIKLITLNYLELNLMCSLTSFATLYPKLKIESFISSVIDSTTKI